jgi:hypothetical protein
MGAGDDRLMLACHALEEHPRANISELRVRGVLDFVKSYVFDSFCHSRRQLLPT